MEFEKQQEADDNKDKTASNAASQTTLTKQQSETLILLFQFIGIKYDPVINPIFPQLVVDLAKGLETSHDYDNAVKKDNFAANKDKCNKFVFDVITCAGANPGCPNGRLAIIGFGSSPPTANQWGDPSFKIPNWVVVTTPRAGDVVARATSDEGHCAIMINSKQSIGASHHDGIRVTYFGSSRTWIMKPGEKYVYRRYVPTE